MKITSFVMILALSLFLFGCNNIKGNQEKNANAIGKAINKPANVKPEELTYNGFLKNVWNFEKHPKKWVFEGKEPAVIDFYASWCVPCKELAPIMDEMAKKYNGKVKFYKVNIDKEQKLAAVFRVRSIPAVLFTPMKGKPMMQVGLLPHDTYVKIIEEQLLRKKQEIK